MTKNIIQTAIQRAVTNELRKSITKTLVGAKPRKIPTIKLEAWDGEGKIVTLNGKPIGPEVNEKDGKIITEWLKVAINDIIN